MRIDQKLIQLTYLFTHFELFFWRFNQPQTRQENGLFLFALTQLQIDRITHTYGALSHILDALSASNGVTIALKSTFHMV